MTKEKIYTWMDKQILAAKILYKPLDPENYFSVCIAGASGKEIHVYGIKNLCSMLGIAWNVEPHDNQYDCYYFMYKGWKFFGLEDKGENK